ncbi:hypothetical protein QYE76_027940 [Lolium multiflorum]|uniref:F-box domain-containing protein n=1 Tax=Lolium multiflorum TaxID=4521 RepID=A0AAD8QKU4_LOLMU|nr:hypothetical protein QYE76_027940 [Lolium multiflorum]
MVGKARRRSAQGRASTRLKSSFETAAERLPDDLLVDILSRVPVKSLCRFKCVSKHWLGLIDHPEHRRKLPQTLVGFFCNNDESVIQFTSVTESSYPLIDTSFAFLPNCGQLELLDCCDGLLLCGCYTQGNEFRYVVFNPATEMWVMLPDSGYNGEVGTTRLGFDRAVSSHFHVFVLLEGNHDSDRYITGAYLYSSTTGRWIYKEKGWDRYIGLHTGGSGAVFLNGYLHLYCYDHDVLCPCVAMVHKEGETWMFFDSPSFVQDAILQQSQGHLHFAGFKSDYGEDDDYDDLSVTRIVVYALKDYDKDEWILKHSIEALHIGEIDDLILIHPDRNTIFFSMGPVMCYNMNRQQAKVVCNDGECEPPYLPYVPLYAELESLHM